MCLDESVSTWEKLLTKSDYVALIAGRLELLEVLALWELYQSRLVIFGTKYTSLSISESLIPLWINVSIHFFNILRKFEACVNDSSRVHDHARMLCVHLPVPQPCCDCHRHDEGERQNLIPSTALSGAFAGDWLIDNHWYAKPISMKLTHLYQRIC